MRLFRKARPAPGLSVWFVFRVPAVQGRPLLEFEPDCEIWLPQYAGPVPPVRSPLTIGGVTYEVIAVDEAERSVDVVVWVEGLTRDWQMAALRRRYRALHQQLLKLASQRVLDIHQWDADLRPH